MADDGIDKSIPPYYESAHPSSKERARARRRRTEPTPVSLSVARATGASPPGLSQDRDRRRLGSLRSEYTAHALGFR
jgi:hypothetical protein